MSELVSLQKTIERVIHEVLAGSGRPLKPLSSGDLLAADIGLDSLDLAQVVVILEQQLKVDPFRVGGQSIRTVDDLHQAYSRLLESATK